MNKMNKIVFAGLLSLFFILAGCSGSIDNITAKEAASAYINSSDNVIAFGSANIDDILTKADYRNVPKLGVIMGGEVDKFKESIDLESPVYYVLEGPMDKDGQPESAYTFVTVKDEGKLVAKLISMGYDIDEKADIKTGQDDEFAIGVKGNLALIVTKPGDFDGEKVIKSVFKNMEGDVSGGVTDDILGTEGDIVFGVSLEKLYATSNTDLSRLDKKKQEEMEAMVKGSFVQTSFRFDEGSATIETKNIFSKELMDRMFFKEDNNASILKKLGKGTPRGGLSINIDLNKLQDFSDDFAPDASDALAREMGMAGQMVLMSGGKDGFAGIFTGKFGALIFGEKDLHNPMFSGFLGLTENGANLGNMAKEFLSYGESQVVMDKSGIAIYTNSNIAPEGKIKLPVGCENFGRSGFSAFFNFEGLDFDELELEGEANMIRAVKYFTVEYNNNGGKIFIKAKSGQENMLKQLMKEIVKELTDEIGGISV